MSPCSDTLFSKTQLLTKVVWACPSFTEMAKADESHSMLVNRESLISAQELDSIMMPAACSEAQFSVKFALDTLSYERSLM